MSKYSSILRDPRWQRKRLEIMERDKWKCSQCGSSESELHVHHLQYKYKLKPWEHSSEYLKTLCDNCHKSIHKETDGKNAEQTKEIILRRFHPWQIVKGVHLLESDMPSSHKYGYSIYKGVLVQWDEDRDTRVLQMLNELPERIINMLIAVHEHEGGLFLIWKDHKPVWSCLNGHGITVDGDWWVFNEEKALQVYSDNTNFNCIPINVLPEPYIYVSERNT